jgi:hypothetical protein
MIYFQNFCLHENRIHIVLLKYGIHFLNNVISQIMSSLILFLKTTVRNNVFCAQFYCALCTTCFGPDRWPSSGNTYIKYTKATIVYVNGSVEIAA